MKRVLVADDDSDMAALIKAMLEERLPVTVDHVTNGALVLDQITATRPDLLILDVSMPGLNGIDVFDLLRGSAPSVDVAVAGSRLVSLVGVAGTATVSPPAGMTERAEIAGGTGSTKTVSEASDASVGAGATGDKTATASRAAPAVAQLIVLRPMP